MIQIESNSPLGLDYKLRQAMGVAVPVDKLELRVEYQERHIPITTTHLQMLSELERERMYEESITHGAPYRSGNLDTLNRFSSDSRGREQAEQELIPRGLIEIDPQGESKDIYHLSALARKGTYIAMVRD